MGQYIDAKELEDYIRPLVLSRVGRVNLSLRLSAAKHDFNLEVQCYRCERVLLRPGRIVQDGILHAFDGRLYADLFVPSSIEKLAEGSYIDTMTHLRVKAGVREARAKFAMDIAQIIADHSCACIRDELALRGGPRPRPLVEERGLWIPDCPLEQTEGTQLACTAVVSRAGVGAVAQLADDLTSIARAAASSSNRAVVAADGRFVTDSPSARKNEAIFLVNQAIEQAEAEQLDSMPDGAFASVVQLAVSVVMTHDLAAARFSTRSIQNRQGQLSAIFVLRDGVALARIPRPRVFDTTAAFVEIAMRIGATFLAGKQFADLVRDAKQRAYGSNG